MNMDRREIVENKPSSPITTSPTNILEEYIAAREMASPIHTAKVTLAPRAVKEMLSFALKFYSPSINSKHEVMGLLVGWEKDEMELYVQRTYPVTYGSPVMVQFKEEHYAVYEKLHLNETKGEFLLGWYHSHPKLGVFLSAVDIHTHATSFQARNPRAIAIVVDPEKAPPKTEWDNAPNLKRAIGVFQVNNPMEPNSSKYFAIPWGIGITRRSH